MMKIKSVQRRGNMVYTEETKPGKAICLAICDDSFAAARLTTAINLLIMGGFTISKKEIDIIIAKDI